MLPSAQGLEALVASLGGRSRFQLSIHLLAASTYIILVFNNIIMAFHGLPLPHSCQAVPPLHTDNESMLSRVTANKNVMNISGDKCSSTLTFTDGTNETKQCTYGEWKYTPADGEKNIVSQFDLVCERGHLSNLATTIYFLGVMLGGLVFGDLADRFGRLPIMLLTLYSSTLLGIITAFSTSYVMFVILRFLTGVMIQGLQTSAYTLIMELYVAKFRPFAGAVTECFFGGSLIVLAGLAYGIKDWRYLQVAISVPGILTIFYPWVVPESIRWLIMKGKMDKAEAVINRICRMNRLPFPTECWEKLKKDSDFDEACKKVQQKKYSLLDLFRTSHLRSRTIILFYIWFAISSSYYGLTFQMTSFKGSRYLIFCIGGAVETVSYALTLPVMKKFGRKKPLLVCFIAAAILCVTAGCIRSFTNGNGDITVVLALAGRCAVAHIFGIIFVYTSEIYPTVIRNIGMGACCLWARAGGVVAPQINEWTATIWGVDAIIIFGVIALIAGLVLFPLPETHNRKLPDSLQQVEEDSEDSHYQDQHLPLGEHLDDVGKQDSVSDTHVQKLEKSSSENEV